MWIYIIVAFVAGMLFVVVAELFILYKWFRAQPIGEPPSIASYVPVSNPEEISKFCNVDGATEKETCMFLNFIFQFLWKEWRDSPKTRNFFIQKMNLEFQEMLLNKAAGKVMEQISVRDYNLGESLPVFQNATIMKIDCKNSIENVPRELDVALDIDYTGGFIISLNVDLIFGKAASITVKLTSLKGRVRLQYTRIPCTHWSFSFYEDPLMELHVDSNFEGKTLPKLTSLISNQIRKAIKKKHTLPRYKVRYKPFFVQEKPQDGRNEVYVHNSLVTVGKINIEVVECTRIPELPRGSHIYCSLSLDSLPWKEDMPMRRSLWPVHEVLMCRAPLDSIGVTFNRYFENDHEIIIIKAIKPNSPASKVDIQKGDLLISVNNVDITTMKQAVRLIKNAGEKFTFKLQRPPPIHAEGDYHLPSANEFISPIEKDSQVEKKAKKQKSTRENEVLESFDYNSTLLRDEDSENEEYVNIVIDEIHDAFSKGKTQENESSIREEFDLTSSFDTDKKGYYRSNGQVEKDNKLSPGLKPVDNSTDMPIRRRSFPLLKSKAFSSPNLRGLKYDSKPSSNDSKKNKFKSWLDSSFSSANDDVSDKGCSVSIEKSKDCKSGSQAQPVNDDETFDEDTLNTSNSPNGMLDTHNDPDSRGWDNISQNVDVESQQDDEEKEPTGQITSLLNASKELVWNETFLFDVEKEHRFLNICVWSKHENNFEKDVLLGYISIPLMELAVECLSISSRKNIRTFYLATTSSRYAVSRASLRTRMPGINLNMCNGDITLAYQYIIDVPECDLEEEQNKLVMEKLKKTEEMQADDDITDNEPVKEHIFVGQEFYFPTRCDYCQNKVWRKVAFQCRVCAMVSHKRCITNAQTNTYCTSKGVRARPPKWEVKEEEQTEESSETGDVSHAPVTTSAENTSEKIDNSAHITLSSSLLQNHENNLRPGMKNGSTSPNNVLRRRKKTLKQPHQKHFRRLSFHDLVSEDQSIESIPEDVEDGDLNDSIATAAVTAKEAGRELFASLDKESRTEGIQEKVNQLEKEIAAENEQQSIIRKALDRSTDHNVTQNIKISLRKSEERIQALALLMIQYCAALNECILDSEPQHV